MTPQNQEQLFALGEDLTLDLIDLTIKGTGYGAMILMTCIATRFFNITNLKTPGKVLLLGIIGVLLFSTWELVYVGAYTLLSRPSIFASPTLAEATHKKILILDYLEVWPAKLLILTNDAIVAWRAWSLSQRNRYQKIGLATLMFINTSFVLTDCIWDTIEIQAEFVGSIILFDWLANASSLVLNAYATSLIIWRAWTHHHFMQQASIRRKPTQAQRTLLLMIDSGAAFFVIQLLNLVFRLIVSYSDVGLAFLNAYHVFTSLFFVVTTWYPAGMTILIKKMNYRLVDESVHFSEGGITTSND